MTEPLMCSHFATSEVSALCNSGLKRLVRNGILLPLSTGAGGAPMSDEGLGVGLGFPGAGIRTE